MLRRTTLQQSWAPGKRGASAADVNLGALCGELGVSEQLRRLSLPCTPKAGAAAPQRLPKDLPYQADDSLCLALSQEQMSGINATLQLVQERCRSALQQQLGSQEFDDQGCSFRSREQLSSWCVCFILLSAARAPAAGRPLAVHASYQKWFGMKRTQLIKASRDSVSGDLDLL